MNSKTQKAGIGKRALAVIIGIVAGGLVTAVIQMISMLLHPMPEGLQISDTEAMKSFIGGLQHQHSLSS